MREAGGVETAVCRKQTSFSKNEAGPGHAACQGAIRTIYIGTDDTVLPLKTLSLPNTEQQRALGWFYQEQVKHNFL